MREKIKLDFQYQWRSYVFKNDRHDDFDFDYDSTEEFKEKQRETKAKQAQ